jgi:prepilin-type N-terminal cleavage/methylation domain-containing protein
MLKPFAFRSQFLYCERAQWSLRAFTLSELLVAIAILGLIATFTIPKVLQNVKEQQKKSVGIETITSLQTALTDGWRSGQITENSTLQQVGDYLVVTLNITRDCPTGRAPTDCITSYPNGSVFKNGDRVIVLPNGAWIELWGVDALGWESICFHIDYNGASGPNIDPVNGGGTATNSDVIVVWFNPTQQTITADPSRHGPRFTPGALVSDYHSGRHTVYNYWFGLPN